MSFIDRFLDPPDKASENNSVETYSLVEPDQTAPQDRGIVQPLGKRRLACELVPLFGPLRPMVFGIDTQRVLDVFASIEARGLDLTVRMVSPDPADRQVEAVVSDAALESCLEFLRTIYADAAQLVSPASMIRAAPP